MRRIKCIAASAMGGFKINGPPRIGKGPMTSKEVSDTSNETSPSRPTQAGRIELCQETIEEAMRCLENNDKQCTMRLIGELVKANCHNGRSVGRKVANNVEEIVYRLWLGSDYVERHEIIAWLIKHSIPQYWIMRVTKMNARRFRNYLRRITIGDPMIDIVQPVHMKTKIIIAIEELLRKELGWNEQTMCLKLWRFIGVNIRAFEIYNINLCEWLNRLTANDLSDARWLGWFYSDMGFIFWLHYIDFYFRTTNAISSIHFPSIFKQIKMPAIHIIRDSRGAIFLRYYITIPRTAWPWPLNKKEAIEQLRELKKSDVAKALAALTDGDGTIRYNDGTPNFIIAFGKNDLYEEKIIKEVVQQQFGVELSFRKGRLECTGDNAVQILEEILPYLSHPLKLLRAKLILMYRNGELSPNAFSHLYEQIIYRNRKYGDSDDLKIYHALEATTQAAPQTHTHGETK